MYEERTEKMCKDLYDKWKNTDSKAERSQLLKDNSIHPVPSGLWGFKHCDTKTGSSSWVFASDSMHNEDLGVFLYIIRNMKVQGKRLNMFLACYEGHEWN